MSKTVFLFTLLLLSVSVALPAVRLTTGPGDEDAVRKVLADQVLSWNRGSVDDFMKGYWDSDSLLFVGTAGISYGYGATLAHYKKDYSDQDKMGKLFFSLLEVKRLSAANYFVVGKWFLKRKAGDVGGVFSLLFRKIDGHWLIIADHTS
jgi:hypothetical protein